MGVACRMMMLACPAVMLWTGIAQAQQSRGVVTATVQGVLQWGEFFGPPNFGESPQTDSSEHSFYLQLPATIGAQNPTLVLGPQFERSTEHFVQLGDRC